MFKKAILFAGAVGMCSLANAQLKCGTDELYNRLKAANPQIAINEAQQEQYLYDKIMVHPNTLGAAMRGTAVGPDTNTVYDVPLVFHIVHDYGAENVSDNIVYNEVALMNKAYSRNGDYSQVIPPYKGNIPGTSIRYVGKANIRFHLATIDPNGQPTNGITHHRSYLSNFAGDEAKFDVWPPSKYINVWIIRRMSGAHDGAAAYAYYPSSGANNPYADGVIALYDYLNRDNTIAHEVGHVLNLSHPWGDTNNPEVGCGDDNVDDTPPTKGHNPNRGGSPGLCDANLAGPLAAIWDTTCAKGYIKSYPAAQKMALFGGDSTAITIDYPDTTNAQNIMDYTYCSKMFTYGQVVRMRAALTSPLAGRNNLWSTDNLTKTGALAAVPDLAPIADFNPNKVFVCANTASAGVTFNNYSYRDTVTSNAWTFSNGSPATSTAANPSNVTFTQPGWVDASLTATSNAGSGSLTRSKVLYAADPTAISPMGYYQEFDGGDVDMFPIFNYYDTTNYKWELFSGPGYLDHSCIRFKNFEPRTQYAQNTVTQTPVGLYADFYTRAFDLSGSDYSARAILNFNTSGAYRATTSDKMNDSLEIYYSTSCGNTWVKVPAVIAKSALANRYEFNEYRPSSIEDWKLQGITLPAGAKSNKTFFRFRYKPGVDVSNGATYGFGTGNNFYLDRINISSHALGVNTAELASKGVTLAPNPTTGSTMVTIKGGDNSAAQIIVTDIAGKVVYRTEARLIEAATQVEIPAEKISVKGMYLVQVVANGNASTQKLVVY